MDFMNDLVSRFQSQMTSYDQHLVDKSIEQRILQGLQNVPRKASKVSNDYLDIDLIRGTPFKKAKPSLTWASFLRKGFCRSIFLPYYFRWWKQHTSGRFACSLIVLYFLVLFHIGLYLSMADNTQIFTSEIVLPAALGIFLTVLFTRISSLHASRKPTTSGHQGTSQTTIKRTRKRGKRKQPKVNGGDPGSPSLSTNGELESHGSCAPAIVVEAESYGSALGWNAVSAVLSPALSDPDADVDAEPRTTEVTDAEAPVAEDTAQKSRFADQPADMRADDTKQTVSTTSRKPRTERSTGSPARSGRPSSLKQAATRGLNPTIGSNTVTPVVSTNCTAAAQRVNTVSFATVHSKAAGQHQVAAPRASRKSAASNSLQRLALTGSLRKLAPPNLSVRRPDCELSAVSSDVTSDPDADVDVDADAADRMHMQMRRFLSAKVKNIPDPTPLSCCEDAFDCDRDSIYEDGGERPDADAGIESLAELDADRDADVDGDLTSSLEQSQSLSASGERRPSPATENELALDVELSSQHVGSDAEVDARSPSVADNGEEEDDDAVVHDADEYGEAENEDSDDEHMLEGRSDDLIAMRNGQTTRLALPAVPDGYLFTGSTPEDGTTDGAVLLDDPSATCRGDVFVRSSGKQPHAATNRVHSPTAIRRHNYALQRERTLHLKQVLTKRKQKRLSQLGTTPASGTEPADDVPLNPDDGDADADEARRVSGELGGSDTEYSDDHGHLVDDVHDVSPTNSAQHADSLANCNGRASESAERTPSGNNVEDEDEHRIVPDGEITVGEGVHTTLRDDSSEYDTMVLNSKRRAGFAALFRERAVKARSGSLVQPSASLSECGILERSRSPSMQMPDGTSARHDGSTHTHPHAAPMRTAAAPGCNLLRRRNVDVGGLHLSIVPDRRTTPLSSHSSLSSSFNAGAPLNAIANGEQREPCAFVGVIETLPSCPSKPKQSVVRQSSLNGSSKATNVVSTPSACTREVGTPTNGVAPSLLALVAVDTAERDASAESDADRARRAKVPPGVAKTDTCARRDSQLSPRSPTHKRVRNSSRSTALNASSAAGSSCQLGATSINNTAKRTTNSASLHSQAQHDGQTSETEWDRLNSDVNGTTDTSSGGEEESADETGGSAWTSRARAPEQEDPFLLWFRESKQGGQLHPSAHTAASDKVSCYIWEADSDGECKKLDLTLIDVGWSIIQRVEQQRDSPTFLKCAVCVALIVSAAPLAFRAYKQRQTLAALSPLDAPFSSLSSVLCTLLTDAPLAQAVVLLGVLLRSLLLILLFLFFVTAERAFYKRLLYAKHFSYITSARRARKYELPHFRLNKVKNIRVWLSLRSYLRKRGPLRSVDMIVSDGFLIEVFLVGVMCYSLLQAGEGFMDDLLNWDVTLAAAGIGIFLMRYMTIGLQIDKKFKNLSILITEQMNLYLHMEQKPHKKEELMMANNVLRLAEELLKQLEHPFTISGMALNPVLYNITKIVLLSAFSGALTEMLGFKLKLYKIKIGSAFS